MDLRERFELIRLSDTTFAPVGVFDNIISPCYSEIHRHYHDLTHLEHAFGVFDAHIPVELMGEYDAMSLAIFFHDVKYDPYAQDNEEKSAALFRSLFSLTGGTGDMVESMILSTKTHIPVYRASKFVLDVDLSILGSSPEEYEKYSNRIRREYAFVPSEHYQSARIRILEGFLRRPRIFHYIGSLEQQARTNIETEIHRLGSSTVFR